VAAALQLPAVTALEQTPALMREIDALLAAAPGGAALQLDATAMTEFDTSAIALLLHAQRAAKERGVTFELQGAPAKLRELAELYGVEELLPLGPAAT
jgi:phospholipid transport system transporter-binding protein